MSNGVFGLLDLHVPTDNSVGWRLDGEEEDNMLPGVIHDGQLHLFTKGVTFAIAAYEHQFVGDKDIPNWRIMVIDGAVFRWDAKFAAYATELPHIQYVYRDGAYKYYAHIGHEGLVDKVALEFVEGDSEPIKDWMINNSGIRFSNLLRAVGALEGLSAQRVAVGEPLKSTGLLGIIVAIKTGNMYLGSLISSMETLLGIYFEFSGYLNPTLSRAVNTDERTLVSYREAYKGNYVRPVVPDLSLRLRHIESLVEAEMSYKEILSHLKD